jgi:hypothetical protein
MAKTIASFSASCMDAHDPELLSRGLTVFLNQMTADGKAYRGSSRIETVSEVRQLPRLAPSRSGALIYVDLPAKSVVQKAPSSRRETKISRYKNARL